MRDMTNSRLRVGLLLEDRKLPTKDFLSIKKALDDSPVDLVLVAISKSKKSDQKSNDGNKALEFISELLKNRPHVLIDLDFFIGKLLKEQSVVELNNKWWRTESLDPILSEEKPEVIHYDLKKVDGGPQHEIPDDIIKRFSETTDVIFNFEHSILSGNIFDAVEYGVLSHHAGDVRKYRGRPACYYQYLNNETNIGRTLQQLTPVLDGGRIVKLRHAPISQCDTIWDVHRKSKDLQEPMLADAVHDIIHGEFNPKSPDQVGKLTYGRDKQTWSIVLRVLAKNWKNRFRRLYL